MQVCLPPSQRPASVTLRGPASSTGEGPPPPLESVCSALCHPTPRVKDSVKTRLQSPSWHLTPTPSGVGTLFCLLMRPGRNGGGQHLAGNTVPHGRSRSQGCGSQDPPGQVRTQGVWGPGQDSSPRPPPPNTHTGCTLPAVTELISITPGLIPGDCTACLQGFRPSWDTPLPWSQPLSADWLCVKVWGTRDQSSVPRDQPLCCPPGFSFLSSCLGQATRSCREHSCP